MGRGIGGGVHENNTHCFLLRMAHLLIFIHNGGIWKGTIQPWLKKLVVLIFLVTKVFQKGYNVQIRQWMFNSQMRCYVTQWSVTSLVAWVCAATLSPRKFGSPVKIALWPFLFSKLLDVSAVFWSFRCIFKSKLLCKQSRPIKSKGQNIKPRCHHIGNFSTMASVLYCGNSNSKQEVKLQAKLPAQKNILRLSTQIIRHSTAMMPMDIHKQAIEKILTRKILKQQEAPWDLVYTPSCIYTFPFTCIFGFYR